MNIILKFNSSYQHDGVDGFNRCNLFFISHCNICMCIAVTLSPQIVRNAIIVGERRKVHSIYPDNSEVVRGKHRNPNTILIPIRLKSFPWQQTSFSYERFAPYII